MAVVTLFMASGGESPRGEPSPAVSCLCLQSVPANPASSPTWPVPVKELRPKDPDASLVTVPIETHYFHFDQQGVVFNMWYLAFVEQARNGYLAAQGYSLGDLLADGHDIQVVHAEIDWSAAVRYGERLVLDVTCGRIGTTSFSLDYAVMVNGDKRATSSMTYVIVDAGIQGKAPLPAGLRAALSR